MLMCVSCTQTSTTQSFQTLAQKRSPSHIKSLILPRVQCKVTKEGLVTPQKNLI